MKSIVLFIVLIVLMIVSIYFTFQRSFVWHNFDTIDTSAGDATAPDSTATVTATDGQMSSTTDEKSPASTTP